ncbi:MAG: NADH-quinone oxidoreductase subunit C [Planctomycetota bacterium]
MNTRLFDRLGAPGRPRGEAVVYAVPAARLTEIVGLLCLGGARFVCMTACDERAARGAFAEYWLFAPPEGAGFVELAVDLDPSDPRVPSVTEVCPAANWAEREAQDLLGVVPVGHPTPGRLIFNDDYPVGHFPLRKDAARIEYKGPTRNNKAFLAEGEAVHQIPVGPIHAGIIEPGHFRFSVQGERVLHLDARLFYTHRGIEKAFEGKTHDLALQIAERVCGVCAWSHGLAFAHAAERAAGAEVPARARHLRVLLGEMERLYNHVGDVANICAGTGFAVGTMHGLVVKERLQALNERLTGNRYLRGIVAVGGLRFDLPDAEVRALVVELSSVRQEFERLVGSLWASPAVFDRLQGTGVLRPEVVAALGVVGPSARASGSAVDFRRSHPYDAYGELPFDVALEGGADVLARVRLRLTEVEQSFRLIGQVAESLPAGPVAVPVKALPGGVTGIGGCESPRGETIHWLRTAADGTIDRLRIRSASYMNWPAVPTTVPGNIVPDFPLINKSFELCYSCTDR